MAQDLEKSTNIEAIRKLGLAIIIPEIARILIENEKKWGRNDPRKRFQEFKLVPQRIRFILETLGWNTKELEEKLKLLRS